MSNENKFKYKGVEVMFGGFYEDRLVFDFGGRVVMVESIKELENEMAKFLSVK